MILNDKTISNENKILTTSNLVIYNDINVSNYITNISNELIENISNIISSLYYLLQY